MTTNSSSPPPQSPDDALPPVEPPSAGFIVQLFVVPGVIVAVILLVWLLLNRVAQTGSDPAEYLRSLRRDTPARWQAAASVADALRNERNAALKQDAAFAGELASLLIAELDGKRRAETDVQFQGFLCKALGEFQVTTGLPALLKAAALPPEAPTLQLRRAAIEAIALLASRTAGQGGLADANLMQVLGETARDEDPQIRGATAFALGVIGSSDARERIAGMLTDAYPDVRYNAATGLARHGDARAVEVLVEMLDPEGKAGVEVEKEEPAREFKRSMILLNALEATAQLHAANPSADAAALRSAVSRLKESQSLDERQRLKADEVSRQLSAAADGQ